MSINKLARLSSLLPLKMRVELDCELPSWTTEQTADGQEELR